MTAAEPDGHDGLEGPDDEDLDVFQPRRHTPGTHHHPVPGFDDEAWTRAASRRRLGVDLAAPGRAEPAPRRQTRALQLVTGTAVVAVCALLAPLVLHHAAPAPGETAAEQAAPGRPPGGPAAASGTTTEAAAKASPSRSHPHSAPRIQPVTTRLPAVTPPPADGGSGPAHSTPATPRATPSHHRADGEDGEGSRAPRGHSLSLQSADHPDRYWSALDGTVRLAPVGASSSRATRRAATFVLVPGLADARCVSFATPDGDYLRHQDFRLRVGRPDGSALFREDATFCARPGAWRGTVSFASYNYPDRLLRHRDFRLRIDPYRHDDGYRADTSFRIAPPWA
ncbi:AbfB domain-containing protein [Streptomyces sp. NPDC046977]|uniref:AbfB domain-containing protein n=1 Tax=Streptomyces sp. NPDC046977 TaxID=3154703 RepID=UPI00340AE073